ncbi:hypothetical protein MUU72_24755 [Streptomyces sp. RS10V-4]|uniref:hypothetical protein n=1 Tax=Streptomyces rhizoryzae TaxID=2932493 RepID=UPI002005827A|nr:hypothetical protein [Streptomyces rhizoryzae]MCK7626274.1 hypothetical protein [Streptomyces rhizoryzae]
MVRNVLGSLIALIGAAAAVWSPFRPWYDGRQGSDIRIEDLFGGLTGNGATLFGSLLLPMAFAGLLTLVGVVLRSRLLITLAGLVVLGFTILWMVRQGQSAGELTAGAHGLGVGAANALGGGALLILGALVMRGRPRRVPAHEDDERDERAPHPPPGPWAPDHPPAPEGHSGPRASAPTRTTWQQQPPTRPVDWGREQRQPGGAAGGDRAPGGRPEGPEGPDRPPDGPGPDRG